MRIGELAEMVGVSTRTVRHYHHVGLLPEPARDPNGYRNYRLRDAVLLARVKRLTELGLSLAEVGDAVARDGARDLREILTELDADLAAQERDISRRRERLADLLRRDSPHPDDAVSAELADVLRALPRAETGVLATERDWLGLLDTVAADPERQRVAGLLATVTRQPDRMARLAALYAELDELAAAAPDDPRVEPLAGALAAALPDGLAELLRHMDSGALAGLPTPGGGPGVGEFLAELAPAQRAVLRAVFRRFAPPPEPPPGAPGSV